MITRESLQAEAKELRDQLTKAQQQLYAGQQQLESINATVERLQGAIIMTEKFLAQVDPPAQVPPAPVTPNGVGQSAILPAAPGL